MKFISHSENQTKKIAAEIAQNLKSNIMALTGQLGAGKTIFAQGFAKGLGIKGKIISPTFVLIRQHKIPNTKKIFYHIDLYRLDDEKSFKSLGLEDLFNSKNIILIEWAEKIKNHLPKETIWINLEKINETERLITVS